MPLLTCTSLAKGIAVEEKGRRSDNATMWLPTPFKVLSLVVVAQSELSLPQLFGRCVHDCMQIKGIRVRHHCQAQPLVGINS